MEKRLAWHFGTYGTWTYGYIGNHDVMLPSDVLGTVERPNGSHEDWKASAAGQEITKRNAEAAKIWVVQTVKESKEQKGSGE